MLLKESVRQCTCKECGKRLRMFVNEDGKLIYFPMNTVRPAYGYFELSKHIKNSHKDLYDLYSFASSKHDLIVGLFDIARG